jgi:hypothetical protein
VIRITIAEIPRVSRLVRSVVLLLRDGYVTRRRGGAAPMIIQPYLPGPSRR